MNAGAAVLHFILGVVIVVFFTQKDAWSNCDVPIHRVSAKQAEEGTRMFYETETEQVGTLPNVSLLLAICVVTCLAHVFYFKWGGYGKMTRERLCKIIWRDISGSTKNVTFLCAAPAHTIGNSRNTHNTQHTTHNTQHTTHNTQHTTHNTQHTTHNTQHTTRTRVRQE
jgi:hypothetical protein